MLIANTLLINGCGELGVINICISIGVVMDWLIGLLLLVVGGIIGFFASKFFNDKKQSASDKSATEQTIRELMTQQATVHVQETKQLADDLITQSTALKEHIESYEQQLISQKTGDEASSLNYFGEHTTAYLRNKSTKPVRDASTADIQPLDFSSQSSGLFSGNDDTPVKDAK